MVVIEDGDNVGDDDDENDYAPPPPTKRARSAAARPEPVPLNAHGKRPARALGDDAPILGSAPQRARTLDAERNPFGHENGPGVAANDLPLGGGSSGGGSPPYCELFEGAVEYYRHREDAEAARAAQATDPLIIVIERYTAQLAALEGSSAAAGSDGNGGQLRGREAMRVFNELLEAGLYYERSLMQSEFHERCASALAKLICGGSHEWERIAERTCRQRSWFLLSEFVLGQMPRRFGKTLSLSMIMIALALVRPGLKQAVFATSARIAEYFGEYGFNILVKTGRVQHIVNKNHERLVIRPLGSKTFAPAETSTLYFYPANPQT